jgi:diadenosine tetraphosphate (Ap4A) HIT family hydrolase
MADCTFCAIIAGDLPASVVHRDQVCIAFMDIQPVNTGHVLVVPVEHAAALADLDPDTGAHMFRAAQRIASAVRASGVRCHGVNLYLADGAAAGQDVFHVHLHVIPRYRGDGFGFRYAPSNRQRPARTDLDRVANQIAEAL